MSIQKHGNHPLLNSLKWVVRLFFRRRTLIGVEHVRQDAPAVFICNHLGSYHPVIMELFFPFPFRPWVTYHIITKERCGDYLESYFVQTELKLRHPFSRWVAAIIAPLCIRIVRATGAIPVFSGAMRVQETIEQSLNAIKRGENWSYFQKVLIKMLHRSSMISTSGLYIWADSMMKKQVSSFTSIRSSSISGKKPFPSASL